jgi:alpha 1,3-glucosidase
MRLYFLGCGAIRLRVEPSPADPIFRYDLAMEPTVINTTELNDWQSVSMLINKTHTVLNTSTLRAEICREPWSIVISGPSGKRMTINPDDTAIFEARRNNRTHPSLFKRLNATGFRDKIINGPTSVALDIEFHSRGVRFSGLPSHTLPFTLGQTVGYGDPIRFYNTDINEYELDNGMSMYGAVPFVLARSGSVSDGVFWCNPSETWADITTLKRRKVRFISEGGFIDVFVFSGHHRSIVDGYTRLTGRPHLVPYFAYGFHQCRWGYKSDAEVRGVSAKLDKIAVPHDVVWLDLDHVDDKKYFMFEPSTFPRPLEFQDHFERFKRKVVVLIDPHLKAERFYGQYCASSDKGLLVRTADNATYHGECWPGKSAWPDFFNPLARDWWEDQYSFQCFKVSRPNLHIWNDMNEISVFDGPEGTAPRDLVHYGGFEQREVHNLYGHLMVSSTFGGLVKRDLKQNSRPFVLTRSFFAGSQRYAGTWTGDNTARWDHLKASIPMVMSYGVAGMVFAGADVGGFFQSPDMNLLARWYQVGAWLYPFFRCHCHLESASREIYVMTGDFRNVARGAVVDRYRLLPYWYTLGRIANLTGEPIVRPVWWEFPKDAWADVDDRAMVGPSLFVVPFLGETGSVRIVFPAGVRWYNYSSLKEITVENVSVPENGGRTPVFVRGGAIIPTKLKLRRAATLMFWDPFSLTVAVDDRDRAEGELYIDDGESFDFARGGFVHRKFLFGDGVLKSVTATENVPSQFAKNYSVIIEQITVTGLKRPPEKVVDDEGRSVLFAINAGVVTLQRLTLPVKDDFAISFIA